MRKEINIGFIGLGTVGSGVWRNLTQNADLLANRLGVRLTVARVGIRDARKKRAFIADPRRVTTDIAALVRDPQIDVVVELIGGCDQARRVILDAFAHGKSVVTANKALLAEHGEKIFAAAAKHHTNIYYEASVAGGIPIIKALREGLVANRIQLIYGIVNGTCNYILSRMSADGLEFATALRIAKDHGYAEADPSFDLDGIDAAHKATILASLAYGFWMPLKKVHVEGISQIHRQDIEMAHQLGYEIKLLAIIKSDEPVGEGHVEVRVHPTLIPKSNVLANVNGVFNAICVRGDVAGDTMYYGRGAGANATASAVISDLADAALNLKFDVVNRLPAFVPHQLNGKVKKIDNVVSRYYLRLSVLDRAGVLAQVASILGRAKIGISSVIQPEGHEGEVVPLIFMIHDARDAAMRGALAKISRLAVVKEKPVMIRVETFE